MQALSNPATLIEEGPDPSLARSISQPLASEASAFAELMSGLEAAAPAQSAAAPVDEAQGAYALDGVYSPAALAEPQVVTGPTLGDRILGGVNQVRETHYNTVSEIMKTLESPVAEPSVAELLQMQMRLGQIMLQEEALSKVVGKSGQNLDTLLRGQ